MLVCVVVVCIALCCVALYYAVLTCVVVTVGCICCVAVMCCVAAWRVVLLCHVSNAVGVYVCVVFVWLMQLLCGGRCACVYVRDACAFYALCVLLLLIDVVDLCVVRFVCVRCCGVGRLCWL